VSLVISSSDLMTRIGTTDRAPSQLEEEAFSQIMYHRSARNGTQDHLMGKGKRLKGLECCLEGNDRLRLFECNGFEANENACFDSRGLTGSKLSSQINLFISEREKKQSFH
jgi:hypothetical protein